MASGLTSGILLVGLAALVAVVVVLALVIGRGRRRDWAEPMSQDPGHATDRAGYGAAGTSYPTAPPPAATPSLSEPVWPTPEASDPTVPTVPGPAAPPSQPEPPAQPITPSPAEPPVPGQPPVPGEPPAPGAPPKPTESFQAPERRLDDTLRFREQNRPDSPRPE